MSANPQPAPALAPLRYSQITLMAKSPAHAKYALDQQAKGLDNWDDTPSKRMGRLAHSVFLGTELPAIFPGDRRGTKVWDAFVEANPGREIVKQDEFDVAQAMADALAAHEEAAYLLRGEREKTIFARIAGRECRSTPDVHLVREHATDLKSTTDASPDRFHWQAAKLGYFGQMAMQKDMVIAAGLPSPARLAIVAVENKAPYVVTVFELTPAAEEYGRRFYRLHLERLLVCEASNDWPGYGPGVLDAPLEDVELIGSDGEPLDVD